MTPREFHSEVMMRGIPEPLLSIGNRLFAQPNNYTMLGNSFSVV